MEHTIFITGTDTDIGKTRTSCLLLKDLKDKGYTTSALKPIASGCYLTKQGMMVNDDALQLMQAATLDLPYQTVNPFAFEKPIAPHIAAEQAQQIITKQALIHEITSAKANYDSDIMLIEGVGGWAVPLNNQALIADVIVELNIPVILIVGIRLGCLNHALLTYHHIVASGAKLIGWVANCVDPIMPVQKDNIATLKRWLPIPCIAEIPFNGEQVSFNTKILSIRTTSIA